MKAWAWALPLMLGLLFGTGWAEPYRQPSPAVRALLDAALPPRLLASPDGRQLALLEPARYLPLDVLARPTLRLAGARFEPAALSAPPTLHYQGLRLRPLEGGAERRIALPAGGQWHSFAWSPDGQRYPAAAPHGHRHRAVGRHQPGQRPQSPRGACA
jgi:hypothetical protein